MPKATKPGRAVQATKPGHAVPSPVDARVMNQRRLALGRLEHTIDRLRVDENWPGDWDDLSDMLRSLTRIRTRLKKTSDNNMEIANANRSYDERKSY